MLTPRWIALFAGSFLLGAIALGAAYATHHLNGWISPALLGVVIAQPVVWGWAITQWALSTDENARTGAERGAAS